MEFSGNCVFSGIIGLVGYLYTGTLAIDLLSLCAWPTWCERLSKDLGPHGNIYIYTQFHGYIVVGTYGKTAQTLNAKESPTRRAQPRKTKPKWQPCSVDAETHQL